MTRDDIALTVRKLIAEKQKTSAKRMPVVAFTEEAHFTDDLDFDSLDHVELVMSVEDEFHIEVPDAAAEELKTVGQAIDYLVRVLPAAVPA